LIEGNAGIQSLSIERPGLHDAFVAIAGADAARLLDEEQQGPKYLGPEQQGPKYPGPNYQEKPDA